MDPMYQTLLIGIPIILVFEWLYSKVQHWNRRRKRHSRYRVAHKHRHAR